MKDHTYDARNDELRARTNRARKADATARSEAPQVESPTTDAEPGSIASLADATDAAIRAASPAPRTAANKTKATKKADSRIKTANATAAMAKANLAKRVENIAKAEVLNTPNAPAPKTEKKKVASLAKAIDAAVTAENVAPTTKPAKVDWLDNGLERTGKLTVDALARAWINHLDEGGKTTASTIASYANDLKTAVAFFGADHRVCNISKFGGGLNCPAKAGLMQFNESDGVMKLKNGAPKAQPTILKMRRAFRMACEWARESGLVAHIDKR